MLKNDYELVIIGGGPAGLAAAAAAWEHGLRDVLIVERDRCLGGILQQCIHNGFGLEYFGEDLTGPEYASRFIHRVAKTPVEVATETMVLDLRGDTRELLLLDREHGLRTVRGQVVILAMGCRERTRGAIHIPGTRPAGVLTAGTAQRFINIEGYMPGREVVVLGSGDIGLIMARRMRLEGAEVKAVLEIMPYISGLVRNQVQCLEDFDIPLYLRRTVTGIHGKNRLRGLTVCCVGEDLEPLPETEERIACDTLLLSVGLIPENELTTAAGLSLDERTGGPVVNEYRETRLRGIFACGNVLHVHDFVDHCTIEAEIAGWAAAERIGGGFQPRRTPIQLLPGCNVRYVVPQRIDTYCEGQDRIGLYLRAREPADGVEIVLRDGRGTVLLSYPRKIVVPGEMQMVRVPGNMLGDDLREVTVDIRGGREA